MTLASASSKTESQTAVSPTPTPPHPDLKNLPQRTPPSLADTCILHGRLPRTGQVNVLISQAAWGQVVAHATSNIGVELGGALLGTAYQHDGQVYLEVQAAIPAVSRDHGPIHFTFSADSWTQLHQDRTANYPNLDIVGWFHTHPGLGVFYSGDDVVVHSAAFTLPWHVGLVVDPVRRESCFFGWAEGQLVPFSGFYELVTEKAASVVQWRVVRTSVWAQLHENGEPMAQPQEALQGTYLPNSERSLRPSFNPGIGLIVGAVGLLLSFFLLVGGVLPLNRQINNLESVVLAVANENSAVCPDPRLRLVAPFSGSQATLGTAVSLLGTADHPDTSRYQLEIRPVGIEQWELLRVLRLRTDFGELASWDTANRAAGLYEIKLTAVDRNNIQLANTNLCVITIELTP